MFFFFLESHGRTGGGGGGGEREREMYVLTGSVGVCLLAGLSALCGCIRDAFWLYCGKATIPLGVLEQIVLGRALYTYIYQLTSTVHCV